MSIFFSRQCEYALQAVMYIALKPQDQMTSIRELAENLGIPFHFLAKILQDLTHRGLLTSFKGPAGGFSLARPATEITPFHIVEAIDGSAFLNNCLLGFPSCSDEHHCAMHDQWGELRQKIHVLLISKNVVQMAKEMKKPQYNHSTDQ